MKSWMKCGILAIAVLLCLFTADLPAGASGIRTSYFALTDVSFGDGPVMAGQEFDCVLTVRATDGDENIEGAVVVLTLPYGLSFAGDSDRVFLGTLQAGKSYAAPFRLRVDEDVRQTVCTVKASFLGTSSHFGIPLETTEDFQVSVTPAERLETNGLVLPERINAAYDDGSGRLDFTLSNNGYVPVTEVTVAIRGTDFEEQEPFYIEEMEPNARENVSLNLVAAEEGSLEGALIISYTNVLGEKKELSTPIAVESQYLKPEMDHTVTIDPGMIQEAPLVPDWVWLPVTLGAIAGAYFLYRHLRMSGGC